MQAETRRHLVLRMRNTTAALLAVALVAALIPARQVAGVDPIVALRDE